MRRSPADRQAVAAIVCWAIGAAAFAVPSAQASAATPVAHLLRQHDVYRAPARSGRPLTTVSAHRPITGQDTALPVVSRRTGADGTRWLRVRVPGRPNGRTGWISARGVEVGRTDYRLRVDLSQRTVRVYRHGRQMRRFRGVIGAAATPTPIGRFFVEETVDLAHRASGGPFALALSARSEVLQEFEGGPGQIALHGRDNLGGTLGRAKSHGCVRLATAAITYLARHIRPGVPVDIGR